MKAALALEKLLACVLLMGEGLIPAEAYQTVLDELFLEAPEDELLLALEWTSDQREARKLILRQSSAPGLPAAIPSPNSASIRIDYGKSCRASCKRKTPCAS